MCMIIVEDVDFSVHLRVLYFGMYARISWTSGYRQYLYPWCNVFTGCRAPSSSQQLSTAYYNKTAIVKHLLSTI